MGKLPYHKRYHSDALAGYMPLSLEERGAYTTLLDLMYDYGRPLDHCERTLAGFFGVSVRKARALVDALEAKGKIYVTEDGQLSNKRFEREIFQTSKTSRKRAENASKRWRKNAEKSEKANDSPTSEMQKHMQTPCYTRVSQKLEAREKDQTSSDEKKPAEPTGRPPGDAQSAEIIPLKADQPPPDKRQRLPDAWRPPPKLIAWAQSEFGFREEELDDETIAFSDHWRGKRGAGASKSNWDAAWRNWIRKSAAMLRRDRPRQGAGMARGPNPGSGDERTSLQSAALRVARRRRDAERDGVERDVPGHSGPSFDLEPDLWRSGRG